MQGPGEPGGRASSVEGGGLAGHALPVPVGCRAESQLTSHHAINRSDCTCVPWGLLGPSYMGKENDHKCLLGCFEEPGQKNSHRVSAIWHIMVAQLKQVHSL